MSPVTSFFRFFQDLVYSHFLYRFMTGFAMIIVLFLVGADTNSVKNFAPLRSGIKESNQLFRIYDQDSFILKTGFTTTILKTNNQTSHLDNKGQVIDPANIQQESLILQTPQFYFKEESKKISKLTLISELIQAPLNPIKKNYLSFPIINVNAPIVYSDQNSSTDIIDPNNPCSEASKNTPLQKLIQKGLVHLYPSPRPGELFDALKNVDPRDNTYVGNTYIVGHSSECVPHEFSKVLSPMQDKVLNGQYFFIWDDQGRQLKFRVFESKEIESAGDGAIEAFKIFPNQRVVTLQTSKYYTNKKINRWIVRGTLELE